MPITPKHQNQHQQPQPPQPPLPPPQPQPPPLLHSWPTYLPTSAPTAARQPPRSSSSHSPSAGAAAVQPPPSFSMGAATSSPPSSPTPSSSNRRAQFIPSHSSRQQQQQQQQQPPHPQQQQIPLPPHHQAQPSLQSSQPIIPPRAAPRGTVDSYGRPISMQYSGRSLSPPARHLQQPSAGPAGGPTMGPIASPPPPSQPFMHSAPQPQSQRISHVPPQHPHGPDAGMNQGSPSSPDMEQQGANRALNVDDALAYLNHVKIQFQEQPDVYNSFLDIMKEFKSQSIDTPGVIERVSSLFHGHPELINGFNTFLPPGFRIEASSNPNEPIRVITPGSHLQEAMPVGTMVPVHPPSQGPQHGHPPIGTYNSTAPPPRIGGGVRSPPQPDPFYPNVAQPIAAQFGGPPPPAMGIPNEGPHGYPISHPSQAPAAPLPPIADLASGAPVKYESSVPAGPPPMPQPAPHHAHMAMHPTGVPTYQTVVSVPPTAPQAPHSTGEPAVAHMQNAPPPAAGGPIPAAGPVPAQPATGPSAQSATAGLRRQPVEFNHAINYVNKIKNRFSNEPDIYKQFFEILQTYQKEGKPIQEVYDQVQGLFKGSPDLLDEFKQFLPDTSQANQDRPPAGPSRMPPVGNFPSVAPNDPRPPTAKKGPKRTPQSQPPLSISSSFGAPPLPPAAVPPGPSAPVNKKRAKPTAVPPPPTPVPITHPIGFSGPVPLISGTMIPPNGNQVVPGQGPIYQPPTAANIIPAGQPNRPDTIEELEWIDRCKRTIGNKATYNEFLKVLNLFSQEIIDAKTLVERVEPFLSKAPELFDWFKKFVKYEENQVIHNVPADRMETDVRTLRRVGHSYRKLPSNYPKPPCSGRDDLCNEVLNDDWISQPEYVSETGFVSHRKTQYEEALHKCEEERYEFDLNIEANLQTIALLEPIYRQIQSMSPEQRTQFKLPPGIGGTSKTIYQRVIKKVYDNDRGLEMIEHLHESPAVAVPIILKRLKQKDEEWKRSQRDWNKVWREVDAKNYYKAMDHQGVSFKTTDKKSISPKALLNEIDNLHREQKEHRKILLAARSSSRPSTLNSRSNPPGINRYTMSPLESSIHKRYQLEFRFPDSHIFRDARRLIMTVVSQTNSITQSDEDRIGDFLSLYVRRFFSLDSYEYGKDDYEDEDGDTADGDAVTGDTTGETNAKDGGVDDSKSESTDDAMEVSSPSAYDATPATGGATGDSSAYSNKPSIKPELRKELLVRRATSSTGIGNGKGAEAESESGDDSASISSVNGSPQRQRTTHTRISKGPRRTYPFYANGTFYTFMRLYQILYSRLLKMKELSNYYEMYPPKTDQINPFAVEMGLQRPENIQDSIASDVKNRFEELHRAIHDFLDSKIEQSEYEEKCRSLYGTNAFLMFTIDKVLQAIVKQLTNIISENVNFQLADLYYKERDRKVFTQKSENLYRLTAQNILAQDDVLYRFEYVSSN
ncbi:hypothetical protein DFJ73DRAFT_482536 [Zopfochytrium polystomum]|nr:hypothetical protein DFJ73DRAFT_482536 [Zopfochytrium polystomum]